MAKLGYVVPETSAQTTETFHALRRTSEGLLYYTKYNKDENISIDFEAGNPTDKNGGRQLPTDENYVVDSIKLQAGATEIFNASQTLKSVNIVCRFLNYGATTTSTCASASMLAKPGGGGASQNNLSI